MARILFGTFVLLKLFTASSQDFFQSQRAGDYAPSLHSVKYIVSLQTSKGQHFCVGSLVHKYWVLTAAHCKTGVDQMMIVAGDNTLGKYEGMEQYSKPYSITPHPLYNKSTNNADIMLIKLRAPIKPNSGILESCLCVMANFMDSPPGGNSCGDTRFPGVYTAVARFRRWIDLTIYRSIIRCYKYRKPQALKSTSSDV